MAKSVLGFFGVLAIVAGALALMVGWLFTPSTQNDSETKQPITSATPAASAVPANEVILIGKDAVVRAKPIASWPACPLLDDLDRTFELIAEHDSEAAMSYAMNHNCYLMHAGTRVHVEDGALLHSARCVRERGKPDCVWIKEYGLETLAAWNQEQEGSKAAAKSGE